MKRNATLKEVAQLANVSTATVSNVINETKYVSDSVKKNVYSAMNALNYVPNTVAKSLRVQESNLIGLIISDISNPFFSHVVRGIEDNLTEFGYNVLLCNTDSDVEKEKKYLKVLLGKRVDGLIVSSSGNADGYLEELGNLDVPVVFLNRYPDPLLSDIVATNNIKGAYTATEHLIQHGYKRIGMITGPQSISTGRDRLIGYKQALDKHLLPIDERLIKEGDFKAESGNRLTKELIKQDFKPDALLISNNFMTLGAYHAIKELGIRVPEDLAIIGYDDPDWAAVSNPSLTAVKQPAYDQGVQAANLICERIKRKDQFKPREIYLDPSLIVRESCGC
ncbi:LacI family DNA-binding transcriptional regulator [Fictibacillus terranigra]|uniref:LacI family DNA-binding transcriptional regulator n=1 Tax=Fictibacillus terranigra TaxID=3058424 RepID=A0ABT8EAL5_9BACL|nr:LacI family DNA-binding transcriptional regulator [Fictibacillus sp. CENA-BCM004]MDN4074948.1 LacI family DNA-binding transcriptional regulator [Fictibacillus sp. CENA-BCM004]